MDKFDCLKVFIRVSQLASFTATASEMNTTQSAISKKIAWLEKQVGITLFHRHARAISLTNAGRQYLTMALKLTDEVELVESQLRQEQTSVTGVLKLSVPSSFSVQLLAKPLSLFLELNPNLSVDVSVSDKFIDLIEDDVDIAIRAAYLKDSGLRAKWLMDNNPVYFASPEYLAAHPPIVDANDLTQHQCLTYALSTPSNLWVFDNGKESVKVKVNEKIRSDNPEMLVKMAKLGQGIAAMPRWMVEDEVSSGALTLILGQYKTKKLPMYLVYKDDMHKPKRIHAFIEFMAEYFDDRNTSECE